MGRRKALGLSALDDKLLDGLRFCTKVYDLFDQIQSEPEGLGKIRLLSSKREKRLLEELIPITQYIQARYRVGNRIKVRWLSGSQPYDAVIRRRTYKRSRVTDSRPACPHGVSELARAGAS